MGVLCAYGFRLRPRQWEAAKFLKQGSHWQQGGKIGGYKSGSGKISWNIPVRTYAIDEDPK